MSTRESGGSPRKIPEGAASRPDRLNVGVSATPEMLSRERRALEVLVRRAVIALGQRCALAGLALSRGRPAPCDPAVECARLELLLDEADRRADALGDRPGDLRLCRDREKAPDVLEQCPVGLREIVRVSG